MDGEHGKGEDIQSSGRDKAKKTGKSRRPDAYFKELEMRK